MTSRTVVPAQIHRKAETLLICVAVAVLVAMAVAHGLARGVDRRPPPLLDWQVSSFTDLSESDQAIHSALIVAGEEIGYMNSDFGDWPAPEELDKILLPPFVKDEFWKQHGGVDWSLIRAASYQNGGDTGYMGVHGAAAGQHSYLLLFRHRHVGAAYANQIDIWIHRSVDPPVPLSTKAEALVSVGWKQVVVYSGADELVRLKER
jgi:hypothetical protein